MHRFGIGQSASFAGDQIVGSGKGEQVSVTVQRVLDQGTSGIRYLGRGHRRCRAVSGGSPSS